MLAGYSDGGWRFIAPIEGMRMFERVSGQLVVRRGAAWETGIIRGQELQLGGTTVMRQQQAAIPDPSGGSVIDIQARAAIAAVLSTLRTHGLIA